MKRFLIVPSLVLAVLLALCILNAAALNRRTGRWMDQADRIAQLAAQIEAVHTDHFLATYSHSHFRPVGESCNELFTKLLRQGVTQHYGIVDGNVQAELQDLAMMMNFEFERV